MKKRACVYILTNRKHGTLYIGVTSNLAQRVEAHRSGAVPGFTKTHGLHRLVYAEPAATMQAAITREKQMKKWNRAWKIQLIETANPDWRDLADELI